jgi:hypothetical protein
VPSFFFLFPQLLTVLQTHPVPEDFIPFKCIFVGMGQVCLEHGVQLVGWPSFQQFPHRNSGLKWSAVGSEATQNLMSFLWIVKNRQNFKLMKWTDGKHRSLL